MEEGQRIRVHVVDDHRLFTQGLTAVLEQGQEEGTLRFSGSASEAAQTIVSGLEGALLIARPYGDVARFQAAATRLLTSLASAAPDPTTAVA